MKQSSTENLFPEQPKNSSRRQFIKNAAVTAVAATGPFFVSKYVRAATEPINIGCIVSLTGYLSDQAQNAVEGLELAADQINKQGGLLGRPLKVVARDDEMKPQVGSRRFEELVKNYNIPMHSGVVFAPISSAISQSNKMLGDKAIVQWQAAVSPALQSPKNMDPNLFFAGSSIEAFGTVGGEHMSRYAGKKTFIFFTDYLWGWTIRDGFLKTATANGAQIAGTIAIPPATTDFQPFLNQLLGKQLDYVTMIVNGAMLINCLKQAYAMGLKDKLKYVTFHVNIEEVNGCGPDVIKDVFMVTDYFWNIQNPKNKQFVDGYFQKYGTSKRPSMRHFNHYSSLMIWADAVRKVGTVDPKKVTPALLGLKGDYGKGPIEIRKTGDHTTVQPIVVARGKGPAEMKDKFDTQEIVKLYTGEEYFYPAKEKGWG